MLEREEIELDLSRPHAVTEARKDGLTTDDLQAAVMIGEVVEDYGERVLLFILWLATESLFTSC